MNAWQGRALLERLRYGIARRLGLDVDLLSSAGSVDELHSSEIVEGPPCIVLPGQYERVSACAFGVEKTNEIAQLRGAPRKIGPTRCYVLEDVFVSCGSLSRGGKRKVFNWQLEFRSDEWPWIELNEAALRSSFVGCHFFGHWLRDDCATHLLAEKSNNIIGMPTPPWPDRAGYLDLFGQSYVSVGRGHIKQLTLYDDVSQNSHKANRLRSLRARIPLTKKSTSRMVYLMRGIGGKQRTLINEGEIIEALSRRGVAIVQAEAKSPQQLNSEMVGARLVISVEGSQLSHALYAVGDDGGVLVIQPPDRFFNSHMDWARALNIRYGLVVGQQRDLGFYLPVDDLLRTIDLMDAELH